MSEEKRESSIDIAPAVVDPYHNISFRFLTVISMKIYGISIFHFTRRRRIRIKLTGSFFSSTASDGSFETREVCGADEN